MRDDEVDTEVRRAAFAFLDARTAIHSDVLPWSLLVAGFEFRGRPVALLGQPGIFNPAVLAERTGRTQTTAASLWGMANWK